MTNQNDEQDNAMKPTETASKPGPRADRITQNGVIRPRDGSLTGNVFAICDKMYDMCEEGVPPVRAEVIAEAVKQDINPSTASTQYGHWCKFMGVKPIRKVPAKKEAPVAEPEEEATDDQDDDDSENEDEE